MQKPRHLAFAGITGFQLYNWYKKQKNTVANAEKPLKKRSKRADVNTVRIVNQMEIIRRFRQRSSSESQMGTGF